MTTSSALHIEDMVPTLQHHQWPLARISCPPKRARIRIVLINLDTDICPSFSPWPQLEAQN